MCTAPEFGFFGGTCGSPAPTDPGDWGEGGGDVPKVPRNQTPKKLEKEICREVKHPISQ